MSDKRTEKCMYDAGEPTCPGCGVVLDNEEKRSAHETGRTLHEREVAALERIAEGLDFLSIQACRN